MEQIATNKTAEAVTTKKEVTFWNKPSTRIFILIGVILAAVWYFTEWKPSQDCISEVRFFPELQPVPSNDRLGLPARSGMSEYYSYDGEQFKTREEAISYCAQIK